ncbi:O-antigen ligase family protein [Robinsoniella peoriensis]|uniref:Lipid A core-O-antigen ligase n=1 Tax=Robinsoniella peoriensis TaxID=180332 RepID=A0A4U8Q8Q3_9FIRM|nr:O-antigen ligase family protein [Robinsoniella peoriensis]MDU7028127.1 O-antigen ligase family protein [Clostridiales bacterium]TLD01350.1 Lipid A core - O-antigen ligase [Robinsoniella peoriensis]
MKLTKNSIIGLIIPLTMLIYNLNWKIGAVASLVSIVCIILLEGVKIKISNSFILKMWATYLVVFAVCLQIVRSYELTISYVLGYVLVILLLIIGIKENAIEKMCKAFGIIALFEAFGIYLQLFLPSVYSVIMGILVESATRQTILSRVSEGYYTGFTREVSLTVIFLILGIGLLGTELLFMKNLTRLQKQKNIIKVVFLFIALLISGKKAQTIFCIVAFLITYTVYSNNKLKILKVIGGIIAIIVLFIVLAPYLQNISTIARITTLITDYIQNQDTSVLTSGRTEIYESALRLWDSNKLFGIGWNNFKNSIELSSWFSRFDVHNCYLQVLCETGIVGAFLFYFLKAVTMCRIVKSALNEKKRINQVDSKMAFFLFFFFFFVLYEITGTCLYEVSYYIPFFIAIIYCEQKQIKFTLQKKEMGKIK